MSKTVREAVNSLREYMFHNVYVPEDEGDEGKSARRIVALLFEHFHRNKHLIPEEYNLRSESPDQAVVDYISGMTDQYAIRIAESISPGVGMIFRERVI